MLPGAALLLLFAAEGPTVPGCRSFDLSLAGIGSLEEDLARTAGLAGSAPLWPGLLRRPSGARPLWLCDGTAPDRDAVADPVPLPEPRWDIVPPVSFTRLLTGWADDRNDGALWAGKGLSSSAGAGVRARWRWFSAQVAPIAAWQQNRDFPAPPTPSDLSPYANPYSAGAIDLPVRMGPSAFWTYDWGQSYLRAEAWNLAAGLSNENLWWGPGIRNSLLMTNTGPGFPHLFVGTARPLDVWAGWLEVELGWGQLRPSKWFDGETGNRRLFEWVVYSFAPAFQRNLTLGLARVWLYRVTGVNRDVYLNPAIPPFLRIFEVGKGNGSENQLASVFFRWAFPEVQFAVFAEWGRDDFAAGYKDLTSEPGHAQAYNLGLEKLFPAGRGWVRLQAEMTHTFEMPPNNPTRPIPVFYTHNIEAQGYTQAGQMIGAGLGPQGDTQFLGLDWISGPGSLGITLERTARNELYFYDVVSKTSTSPFLSHDVEMAYGARGSRAWREWDLTWALAYAHRESLGFRKIVDALDATLRVSFWPGRTEAPALPPPRASR